MQTKPPNPLAVLVGIQTPEVDDAAHEDEAGTQHRRHPGAIVLSAEAACDRTGTPGVEHRRRRCRGAILCRNLGSRVGSRVRSRWPLGARPRVCYDRRK
jgi:hypothetical protein